MAAPAQALLEQSLLGELRTVVARALSGLDMFAGSQLAEDASLSGLGATASDAATAASAAVSANVFSSRRPCGLDMFARSQLAEVFFGEPRSYSLQRIRLRFKIMLDLFAGSQLANGASLLGLTATACNGCVSCGGCNFVVGWTCLQGPADWGSPPCDLKFTASDPTTAAPAAVSAQCCDALLEQGSSWLDRACPGCNVCKLSAGKGGFPVWHWIYRF